MSPSQPPVIVVGASLVGLSAALCLSYRNIPTIVLERHAAISDHPRALKFTSRTVEIYRYLGIAHQLPEFPENFWLYRARVSSLAGEWFESTSWSDEKQGKLGSQPSKGIEVEVEKQFSPTRGAGIPQDQLERILENTALANGVDIRRRHTVENVQEDEAGVLVTVTNADGMDEIIRGSYLLAAEGNRSRTREQFQIARHGRGHMQIMRSVLFRARFEELLQGVHQFSIDQPEMNFKAFMTTYMDGRWVLIFHDDEERDRPALLAAIRAAIGKKDIPVEIITTGRWHLEALVAEKFQAGRKVFLVGDAAHTLPPNRGGYAANTGIHDVENLAWKIGAVLRGESKEEILDTYEMERRPVAQLRHDQIFARADYRMQRVEGQAVVEQLDDDAVEFGELYVSPGFIGVEDRDNLPAAKKPDEWVGHPGTRVPYFHTVWQGRSISVLEIVDGKWWTLLTSSSKWEEAVEEVNARSSVPIILVQVEEGEVFQRMMGVSATGASLIRPDGYISWRAVDLPSEPAGALDRVLQQVAFRTR